MDMETQFLKAKGRPNFQSAYLGNALLRIGIDTVRRQRMLLICLRQKELVQTQNAKPGMPSYPLEGFQ